MSFSFGEPVYGLVKTLPGTGFFDAVPVVKEALAKEGFGVLTEIDVKATMKAKLDVDHRDYVILGACNPPLAHKALSAVPSIGLLLPCNVVVTVDDEGNAVVAAFNPEAVFEMVDHPEMASLAADVKARLQRVVDGLG
jgi:uncharacterized protein (DUF302 family)